MPKPSPRPTSNATPSPSDSARTSPLAARVRAVGNRRGFFAKSSIALAGSAALATEQAIAGAGSVANHFHVAGDDTLRIGLIGCGARGRAAASEALQATTLIEDAVARDGTSTAGRVELVAMADAYSDQLQSAYRGLKGRHQTKVNVGDRRFVGMNAWAELLQCDVDLVILATPPVFRPQQFSAAVDAGKHVALESFAAVDATGIQQMRTAAKLAGEKNLAIAGGLPRRHEARSQDFVGRLHDGIIGEIGSIQIRLPHRSAGLAERRHGIVQRDFELRNWQHFHWTGGDLNLCEHFHLLDLANWIFQAPAESAIGSGDTLIDGSFTMLHGPSQVSIGISDSGRSGSRHGDLEIHGTDATFLFQRGQVRDSQLRVRWQSDLKEPVGGGTRAQLSRLIQSIRNGQCLNESQQAIDATHSAILAQRCFKAAGRASLSDMA